MNSDRQSGSGTSERRRERRSPSLFSASIHFGEVRAIDCVVRDISPKGARVATERGIDGRDNFILDIDGVGLFPSKIVWRNAEEVGLEFVPAAEP